MPAEIRQSPVLCSNCNAFIGEVDEEDIAAATRTLDAHRDTCPRGWRTIVKVGRLAVIWRKDAD